MKASFDRLRTLRSDDLHRLPDGDAGMAARQQVDALVTGRDERVDIELTREPRAAIGVVALARERGRPLVDDGLPMGQAAAIDSEASRSHRPDRCNRE